MYKACDIAMYFLNKDTDKTLFTLNLLDRENHTFYEGNARVNKYLHIAQNMHIAKYGEKLFKDDLIAYDNGAIVKEVLKNFPLLYKVRNNPVIDEITKDFLDRIYKMLENASIEELIEISHEDEAWISKHNNKNSDQLMDSMEYKNQYKEQYKDALFVLDRIKL